MMQQFQNNNYVPDPQGLRFAQSQNLLNLNGMQNYNPYYGHQQYQSLTQQQIAELNASAQQSQSWLQGSYNTF